MSLRLPGSSASRLAVIGLIALGTLLRVIVTADYEGSSPRNSRVALSVTSTPEIRRPVVVAPAEPLTGGLASTTNGLLRGEKPVTVTGINAYEAATWWGTNWGCGSPVYDLNKMFDQLPAGSLFRVWAFQAQGWNNKQSPQHIDFTGIDRVVAAAEATHRQLILTLSDQAGTCDDGLWHDQSWYDGGYTLPRADDDGRGLGDLSYLDWVKAVVTRYRDSPAVAMWEPVNEPEASNCTGATGGGCEDPSKRSCPPGAAASLASFFTAIGTVIRGIDPHHLISEGVSAGGQCGVAGDDFLTIGRSSGIDVLTYHDYGDETEALPTGLAERLNQAKALGKPLLVEEAGLTAGTVSGAGCQTLVNRSLWVALKATAAINAGAVGWMPWWYDESGPAACNQDYGPSDPALRSLAATSSD